MLASFECVRGGSGRSGKRIEADPFKRFTFTLALALGKTVKEMLSQMDSRELTEWWAFHRLYPLPDPWRQTARICRTVMASSGNYKNVPDEERFIPGQQQTQASMFQELSKLKAK